MGRWVRLIGLIGLLVCEGASSVWGQDVEWRAFEEALAEADTSGHPVFVHVYAPWCGWCHKMKTEVYPSEEVRGCLSDHFIPTRLNRDDTETRHRYQGQRLSARRLATTLGADAVPTVVFLAPDGRSLFHLSGYVEPAPLEEVLSFVASGAYRDTSFETFRREGTPRCKPPLKENERGEEGRN